MSGYEKLLKLLLRCHIALFVFLVKFSEIQKKNSKMHWLKLWAVTVMRRPQLSSICNTKDKGQMTSVQIWALTIGKMGKNVRAKVKSRRLCEQSKQNEIWKTNASIAIWKEAMMRIKSCLWNSHRLLRNCTLSKYSMQNIWSSN